MSSPALLPLELTIADPFDGTCANYHRYFRQVPGVDVKTSRLQDLSRPTDGERAFDVLILPLPNCHGVAPTGGYLGELSGWLGQDFWSALQQAIHEKSFGEMLPGSSLVLDTLSIPSLASKSDPSLNIKSIEPSLSKSQSNLKDSGGLVGFRNFSHIVVVCALRVLTPQGDSMAWLDPIHVPEDWAYNAMREALIRAHKDCRSPTSKVSSNSISSKAQPARRPSTENADDGSASEDPEDGISNASTPSSSAIKPLKILCPDFHALRASTVDTSANTPVAADLTAKQVSFAWKGLVQSITRHDIRKTNTWADAILLQRLLLSKDSGNGHGAAQPDLLSSLSTADLENRSLYSAEELQVACNWVRDPTSTPDRALNGARLISNAFSSDSSQYGLSRAEIARVVTHKDTGCLPSLLHFVQTGQIRLYVEIPPEDLVYGDEIGTGTAGSVVRATWNGKPVAVKKFKGVELGDFLKELSIMSLVQHPNLVECYGGCSRNKDTMYIVQELMDCNISDVLRLKPIVLDLGIRLRIAIEVAKGVSYLHNHCNLIHRDLKSLNLLATVSSHDFAVKVCDFGVSRIVDRRKTMTGNVGTVSWIAPEVFEQRKYSEKADVYSFGIVLWELLTRRVPFADIHSFSIPVAVIKGDRPSIPKDCPSAIKKLIRECWQPKASKRPPFPKVIEILQKILEQTPPNLRQQLTFSIAPLMLRKKNSTVPSFSRHQKTALAAVDGEKSPSSDDLFNGIVSPTGARPSSAASLASPTAILGAVGSPHDGVSALQGSPARSTSPKLGSPSVAPKRKKMVTASAETGSSIYAVESGASTGNPDKPEKSSSTTHVPSSAGDRHDSLDIVGSPPAVTVSAIEAAAEAINDDDGEPSSSPHTSSTTTTVDSESPSDLIDSITGDSGGSTLTSSTSSAAISLQRKALSSRAESSMLPPPQHTRTVTCTVPDKWAPPIAKLEVQVNKYFSKLKQDLDSGTIMVNNERYLLFRAKSLAVDFFNLVQTSFNFEHSDQSLEFAQNFLYDLGTAIGKADAQHFLASAAIEDPLTRNNAGLVHIAYTGMAFINLRPESVYSKHQDEECLLYEYTYSFESDCWSRRRDGSTSPASYSSGFSSPSKQHTEFCTCMMSAGYMSGWGEGATGSVRATAEISCKSKGDHSCLFVRSVPYKLESMVKKASQGQADPLPKFLKNRSDTTPSSHHIRPDPATDEGSWFQQGFRQLFKRTKKSSDAVGSPRPATKFNVKSILPAELSIEEIDIRASKELNSFFIDPTTATVEMADERCVLLRGDALAHGFYSMVHDLFGSDDQGQLEADGDKHMSRQFAWKFLYDLGKTIATSNLSWFSEKIGLPNNAIERINSLPVNMAYFGWCDLIIRSGHSYRELTKAKESFVIVCEVANSFEAASWSKNPAGDKRNTVCYMHAGYLCGWFESALRTTCVAVETSCGFQTGKPCLFTIAHSSNIKKVLANHSNTTIGLNTATAVGVLPLLAKFKEKRRESTPIKLSAIPKALSQESGVGSGIHHQRITASPGASSSPALGSTARDSQSTASPSKRSSSGSKEKDSSTKSNTGDLPPYTPPGTPPPPRLDRSSFVSTSSDSIAIPSRSRLIAKDSPARDSGAPKREKTTARAPSSGFASPSASAAVSSSAAAPVATITTKDKEETPSPSRRKAKHAHGYAETDTEAVSPRDFPPSPMRSRSKPSSIGVDSPLIDIKDPSRKHKDKHKDKEREKDREKDPVVTVRDRDHDDSVVASIVASPSRDQLRSSKGSLTRKHKSSPNMDENPDFPSSSKEDTPSKKRPKHAAADVDEKEKEKDKSSTPKRERRKEKETKSDEQ